MIAIAALIFTPNILWNAANAFQTVAHTAANANWGASLFKPMELLSFWSAQFGVFGFVLFGGLLWAAFILLRDWRKTKARSTELLLLVFALTPLIIVSLQAFISRAHANWAAAAFPAGVILVTHWLIKHRLTWAVRLNAAVHLLFAVLFAAGVLNFSLADRIQLSTAVKDIRGWRQQSVDIASMASGYDVIMADDRPLLGELFYYLRDTDHKIIAWDPNARIDNHYEAFTPFDYSQHKRILFVTTRDDDAHVNYRFKTITPLGMTTVKLGAVTRSYHLFALSDYFGPETNWQ